MKRFSSIIMGLVLSGVLFWGGYYWYHKKYATPQPSSETSEFHVLLKQKPILVSTSPLTRGFSCKTFTTFGHLVPIYNSVLRTGLDGIVKEVYVKPGDFIQKNQILFTLEDDHYKSEFAKGEETIKWRELEYKRVKELNSKDFSPAAKKQEAYTQLKIAQADWSKAKAALEKTIIRAPYEGRLGLETLAPGTFINHNQEVLHLVGLPQYVDFYIPSSSLKDFPLGQEVMVFLENNQEEFKTPLFAHIMTLDPRIHRSTHEVKARALLKKADPSLISGQYVRLVLEYDKTDKSLLVPESALKIEDEGKTSLFLVVRRTITVHEKPVSIQLAVQKPVMVEARYKGFVRIREDPSIQPDSVVVTGNLMNVHHGSLIQEKPEEAISLPTT